MMRPFYRRPHDHIAAALASWSVPALLHAYNWPTGAPGGATIAIGELGGTWYPDDIAKFFAAIGQPVPAITNVGTPSPDPGADVEVALDIQVAAAAYQAATEGKANIRVYFAPNTAAGFSAAIVQAAADGCDVMAWSWGAAESQWGKDAAEMLDAAAAQATAGGMLLTAAAGDTGYDDGTPMEEVDFPASSPHFLACGGTRKVGMLREVVWHDRQGATGGGYSDFFPVQPWQVGSPPPPDGKGRMVSDVAANADPQTGYQIIVHGKPLVIGGTSAVAPLYAGLIAAFGPKPGFRNGALWADPSAFTKVIHGNNGLWPAYVCCGLGAPNGAALAKILGPMA